MDNSGIIMAEYVDFSYMDKLLLPVGLSVLNNRKERCLYKVLVYAVIAHQCLILITEAIAMSQSFTDIHHVTINACVMMIVIMAICKAVGIAMKKGELAELVRRLQERFPATGPDQEAIMKGATFHAHFVTVFFSIMSISLIFLWNSLPLVQNWYLSSRGENGTTEPQRNLPMIAWYPYDTTDLVTYTFTYLFQVYGALNYFCIHIGTDTFYVGYFIYISAHLKVLCHSFRNIRENSIGNFKNEKHVSTENSTLKLITFGEVSDYGYLLTEINKVNEIKELRSEGNPLEIKLHRQMHAHFVKCVKIHQEVIRFVKDLEAAISPVVLIQFFNSALIICLSGFQATVTIDDQGMFLKFVVYMTTAAFQLMLYCWYGQYLIDHGEAVQMAAYSCGWTDASPSFKRSLRIVILRAQRPLKLTAGKIYVMSLDTFVKLLNASYSFFAVLRQLNDS